MRPPISLAEAIRAAYALAPGDADTREALLAMLGLATTVESGHTTVTLGVWKPSSTEAVGRTARPPASPIVLPPGLRRIQPPPPLQRAEPGARTRVTQTTTAGPPPAPAWVSGPGPTLAEPPADSPPVPPPSLFSPRTERAILSAALGTYAEEGDLDMERILEGVAEKRALEYLPRQRVATLRRGAQVLVDLGAGMDPYRQDVERLVAQLDSILADDRLTVAGFAGTPLRGLDTPVGDRLPWSPPPAGSPVVLVTDLGIGGPLVSEDRAHPAEWLVFASGVRRAGHPLIAFVPYEARRWPSPLARAITILHWSERTTVGAIRRAVRESTRAPAFAPGEQAPQPQVSVARTVDR